MEWVYPYSPVVDLADIARAMSGRDGSGGHFSLPVFQAIMFAGIGFVEMSSLQIAGFQSRKEAKKAFFRKVKVSLSHQCNAVQTDRDILSFCMILATILDRYPSSKH
jgi:hypothetical protein